MKPRQNPRQYKNYARRSLLALLAILSIAVCLIDFRSSAQGQIQVTAADPATAEQGTVTLNVRVTGKGFKNGAQARWFVTGTTNPGGVTVNSTIFVSSTELTANITLADTAVVANFDIQVLNSDGRGGKGTELFAVTPKGGGGGVSNCPAPAPAPTSDTKCYAALPGCLDTTFGLNGLVTTDTNGPNINQDRAEAMVIQSDGKIVTAGSTYSTASGTLSIDFLVVRYNTDGSLDTSFGDADPLNPPLHRGYVVTSFGTGVDQAHVALLQPDGKIVVGGYSGSTFSTAIARYNTDGTLDPTFGSGGKVFVDVPDARSMAMQSDSKLLLGGDVGDSFVVARLNPNGTFDSGFGTGGKVVANATTRKRGGTAVTNAIAVQRVPAVTGEERIVVGGRSDSGSGNVFTLMRFNSIGTTDTTFGTNGRVYTSFFGFGEQIFALGIDSSNRIVAGGYTYTANSSCGDYVQDLALARYTQDGLLDNSFSGDGRLSTDVYGGSDWAQGVALQPDGKILIAGFAKSSDRTFWHFALVRYNPNGTPDSSFGILGTGIVSTHFAYPGVDHQVDWGKAVALQPWDGKIVVVGHANDVRLVALARYWP
jgi:uncharacterized delta-60 repeat protein